MIAPGMFNTPKRYYAGVRYSLFVLVMCNLLQRISNHRENEPLKKRINYSKITIAW